MNCKTKQMFSSKKETQVNQANQVNHGVNVLYKDCDAVFEPSYNLGTERVFYIVNLNGFETEKKAFISRETPLGHREGTLHIVIGEVSRSLGWATSRSNNHIVEHPEKYKNQLLFVGTREELAKAGFQVVVTESDEDTKRKLTNAVSVINSVGDIVKSTVPPPFSLIGTGFNALGLAMKMSTRLIDNDLELQYIGRVPLFSSFSIERRTQRGSIRLNFTVTAVVLNTNNTRKRVTIELLQLNIPGTVAKKSKKDNNLFKKKIRERNVELQTEATFGSGADPQKSSHKMMLRYAHGIALPLVSKLDAETVFDGVVDIDAPLPFSFSATYYRRHKHLDGILDSLDDLANISTDISNEVRRQRMVLKEDRLNKLKQIQAETNKLVRTKEVNLLREASRQAKIQQLEMALEKLRQPPPELKYYDALRASAQPVRTVISEFLPDIKASYIANNLILPALLHKKYMEQPKSVRKPISFYLVFQDGGAVVKETVEGDSSFVELAISFEDTEEQSQEDLIRILRNTLIRISKNPMASRPKPVPLQRQPHFYSLR